MNALMFDKALLLLLEANKKKGLSMHTMLLAERRSKFMAYLSRFFNELKEEVKKKIIKQIVTPTSVLHISKKNINKMLSIFDVRSLGNINIIFFFFLGFEVIYLCVAVAHK